MSIRNPSLRFLNPNPDYRDIPLESHSPCNFIYNPFPSLPVRSKISLRANSDLSISREKSPT